MALWTLIFKFPGGGEMSIEESVLLRWIQAILIIGGGFAEYVVATPDQCVVLPDSIDPKWGLGEPVACCVHAMMRSRIRLGDRVAILGCGFMGLVCLQLASLMGASSITAIDLLDWRLAKAKEVGAD